MKIKAILETSFRYPDVGDPYEERESVIDTLKITIPLPGGTANYEIDLPKGVKANLEFASQLSEKS